MIYGSVYKILFCNICMIHVLIFIVNFFCKHMHDSCGGGGCKNYLEEDHTSHGITIQEPRPRPMKETLHSRHLSTVLPRLGSNRMESHQNLHTHAVDSAIQLQGNNRVLKKHPPPISDEEQRLNRRQRCTLSQLRSGHCHLLQDYKHRMFGEPSDICIDWSFTTRCETPVRLHHTPD